MCGLRHYYPGAITNAAPHISTGFTGGTINPAAVLARFKMLLPSPAFCQQECMQVSIFKYAKYIHYFYLCSSTKMYGIILQFGPQCTTWNFNLNSNECVFFSGPPPQSNPNAYTLNTKIPGFQTGLNC